MARTQRVALIRVILVSLSVLLGFTLLSLLSVRSDTFSEHVEKGWYRSREDPIAEDNDVLTAALSPVVKEIHRRPGMVQWKLYGVPGEPGYTPTAFQEDAGEPQPLLDSIPASFQDQMMSGLQLTCHPGKEGIFKEKYSRFLYTLQHYVDHHHAMKNATPSSRTLTWHCPIGRYCGGLGDRIRGVIYTLLLAMFSRRRLVVYWDDQPEGAYFTPHMIDWRDMLVYEFLRNDAADKHKLPDSFEPPSMFSFKVVLNNGKVVNDVSKADMSYYQRTIASNKTNVMISTNLEPRSLLDPGRNGNQDWIRSGLEWCGLSHLSPSELDDVVGIAFRYLFRLKDGLLDEVEVARETLGLTGPYTALHLRTGFAGMSHHEELYRHPKLQQNVSQWHSIMDCAAKTANRQLGNSSLVYLATDSNLVKKMAAVRYPDRFRTLQNSLVHVDKLGTKKGWKLGESDEREGVIVVWVELLLLAQAKVLVSGESGFSWTAGLVCGMHGDRTVHYARCK